MRLTVGSSQEYMNLQTRIKMNTQIVYVLIGSERTLFLEELWVSLYSLRHFHPTEKVTVLVDEPTEVRIKERKQLYNMISELRVVDVPEEFDDRLRSRYIKTKLRCFIKGDYLYIDTDTIITEPLDEIDNINVKNIGMVPEMHGTFKEHMTYNMICNDVKRVFNSDVSDSRYWYNTGCMLVRDNDMTHEFFKRWNKNWKYSALKKNVTSDMRAMIYTDKSLGYICESIPDVYNCQLAMSIKYLHKAKILHFWHMRCDFTPMQEYSPFTSKEIYRRIRTEKGISQETANTILNAKSSFDRISMVVGESDRRFLFSGFQTVLWKAYNESSFFHWLFNVQIWLIVRYQRVLKKFSTANKEDKKYL